jgi:hypothetical protein
MRFARLREPSCESFATAAAVHFERESIHDRRFFTSSASTRSLAMEPELPRALCRRMQGRRREGRWDQL